MGTASRRLCVPGGGWRAASSWGWGHRMSPQEEVAHVCTCACARVLALVCEVLIPSSPQHSFLPPSVVL